MQTNVKPMRLYRGRSVVTIGIIVLLAVIFLADRATALLYGQSLSSLGLLSVWGLKVNEYISAGQWWRLITASFLHVEVWHILTNCFGLYIWGRYIETFYGRWRTAVIMLVSGFVAVSASYAFSSSPSLGASGMVFGLYGGLLGIRNFNKQVFNAVFGVPVLIFLGISFFYGFSMQYVDNFAHAGGLIGGYLIARVVGLYSAKVTTESRILYGLGLLFFTGICVYIGYAGWPF